MNPALIRCPGCDRSFVPSGLAHHVSKSPDSRCRSFNAAPQTQSISASLPQTTFSPALAPIYPSWVLGDDGPGNNFNSLNGEVTNGSLGLEAQLDAGEFAATHIITQISHFLQAMICQSLIALQTKAQTPPILRTLTCMRSWHMMTPSEL